MKRSEETRGTHIRQKKSGVGQSRKGEQAERRTGRWPWFEREGEENRSKQKVESNSKYNLEGKR